MTQDLKDYMDEKKAMVDQLLPKYLEKRAVPEKLKQAMLYSLTAGGKRIRPILLFAVIEALEEDPKKGMSPAIALEMIHTYSLIHDDLPAMDDDDLRRGKPTNHKMFGEATAMLAGDGLLTYAFEVIAGDALLSAETRIRLVEALAHAAGPEGMVGGQQDDLDAETKVLTIKELESVHSRKTGKLLNFPVTAGALIGGAEDSQMQALSRFADHLGLAFQIGDDILDIEGNPDEIGKPVGSDIANHKNTYPSLLTMDGAKRKLVHHVDMALSYLHESAVNDIWLKQIAQFILYRTH
ncbi:polyprenyl synthetase family protein [Terrilactibacillus sp. S3-3]|nr:polyprenyl synthetase family protein [Terrilactibacillus sp. S3-3]